MVNQSGSLSIWGFRKLFLNQKRLRTTVLLQGRIKISLSITDTAFINVILY